MSEASTQALIRIGRLAVIAVIGVLIANATVLIGLIPDDSTKYLVSVILVPLLDGIAKLIGGPTTQPVAPAGAPRGARARANVTKAERPSILSV